MSEQPGIMIYFDVLPALEFMSMEQRGQWITAALEYSHYGVIPQLDGMCAMAWAFTKPKLDRDKEQYNLKCLQSKYATYCREEKKQGRDPLEFETWLTDNRTQLPCDNERYQAVSPNTTLYPTITSSETATTTPSETVTEASSQSKAGVATEVGVQGEKEKRSQEDEFNSKRNRAIGLLDGYGA